MVDASGPKASCLDALFLKGRYTIAAGLCFGVTILVSFLPIPQKLCARCVQLGLGFRPSSRCCAFSATLNWLVGAACNVQAHPPKGMLEKMFKIIILSSHRSKLPYIGILLVFHETHCRTLHSLHSSVGPESLDGRPYGGLAQKPGSGWCLCQWDDR